uniref:Supervillin putative n=1 Tax=Pandinus cavimanus TaxID=217261 RepID=H2CYP3_PANCV|nr:supervillin putative [Pandinus cavimanus]
MQASKSIHELRTSTHVSVKDEKSVSVKSQHIIETESRGFVSPQRSYTQPLTPGEKDQVIVRDGGSIAERLAALQRSGEEQWRKRLTTLKTDDPEGEIKSSLTVIRREVKQGQLQRPSSIADRLSLLEEAQDKWKSRVEEKDATKFTVAGKMGHVIPQHSPLLDRERRTPKPVRFRSKTTCIDESLKSAGSPTPISKSKSMPNALRKEQSVSSTSSSGSEEISLLHEFLFQS